MVKKTKLKGNDLPLEDGLDIPDFDFDFGEPKDDRSPVHKILASAATGAKDSFKDTSYIKRLLRATLPPVYGEVDDTVSLIGNNFKKLYNTAAKEIKPSVAELSRSTEKLIPERFKRTKSGIGSVKDWAEEYKPKTVTASDKNAIRDKGIAIEIADIFAINATQQQQSHEETKAGEQLRDSLQQIRHKDSQSVLTSIDRNISRFTQYQANITQAFQRKSLELQYRNYFVNMESLEVAKETAAHSKTSFASVIKNTALPEFVKLKNSERFVELARTKTMETLFGGTKGFIDKSFSNLTNIVKEYTEAAKDGLMAANMMAENADMMSGDMGGPSMKETLAAEGTKGLVQHAFTKFGRKIGSRLNKNEKVKKIAGDVRYGLQNAGELAIDAVNNDSVEDNGFMRFAKTFGREIFGNQKPDSTLQADGNKSAIQPGMFTNYTNKSITEIIPGYLSRIFRELQVIRSGDDSIKLTKYDIYSNKFIGSDALKKTIVSRLIPEGAVKSHQQSGKEIFDLIDPDGKLSEAERKAIFDKITKDKFTKKLNSADRLSSASNYKDIPGLEGSEDKVADAFRKYFTADGTESFGSEGFKKRRNTASTAINEIGRFLNNPGPEIQQLINSGYYEQLRELGFINDSGNTINMEEVLRRYNPGEENLDTTASDQNISPSRNRGMRSRNRQQTSNVRSSSTQRQIIDTSEISKSLTDNSALLREFLASNKDNQDKFSAFINNQAENITKITTAVTDSEIKILAPTTDEILLRIESFLINELKFTGNDTGNSGVFDPESQGYYRDSLLNNVRGIGNRTIKGIRSVTKPINRALVGTGKFAFNSTIGIAKGALGKISNVTDSIADIFISMRDIYVEGELTPRIDKVKMKAGEYYDSVTGKVITSIGDLKKAKGDIKDKTGSIVLFKSEFGKTFVKSLKGSAIVNIGKSLFSTIGSAFKSINSVYFTGIKAGIDLLRKGRDTIGKLIDQPVDIYVKGIEKPVLLAIIMINGGYISEKTGQPVLRPGMIDGPVKDLKGNFVLTMEQLKEGIFDINGKPIKTPMMKIMSAIGDVAGRGLKAVFRMGKFAKDTVLGGLAGGAQFFKDMFANLSTGLAGRESLNVLEQIRNILDSRLPNNNKVFGDKDGDGDRDGSYADLTSKEKKEREKAERTNSTIIPNRENSFDRMTRLAGEAKDKVAGWLGMGDDDDGIDIDIDGPDNDRRGRGRRRRGSGSRGKKGLVRKVMGGAGRLLGGAAGLAGRGLLAAGSLALPAASALASTAVSAGGAILGGAGAVSTGIASLLSAPVVLGAAAVGLAGYGAYKAYKYFNKPNMEPLSKLRMSQYGFTVDDTDYIGKIQALENKLFPIVKYSDGKATLDMDEKTVDELFSLFDLEKDSTNTLQKGKVINFTVWFRDRFKPVFLTSLTVLNNLGIKQKLDEVDKAEPSLKMKFLEGASFTDGPYSVYKSPFEDLPLLQAGVKLVLFNIDAAKKVIKEEIEKSGKKENKLGTANTVAAMSATAGITAAGEKPGLANIKKEQSFSITGKIMDFASNNLLMAVSPFAALGSLVIKKLGPVISKFFGFGLEPLETIRFKTYGLVEMDRSKVSALRGLEELVQKNISFDSNGSAIFNGKIANILSEIGSDFSISSPESEEAKHWIVWFNGRFLPTYLNFAGLLKQYTGTNKLDKGESVLKASEKLELAKKLITTPGVWNYTISPWKDYVLNIDIRSVDENIAYLKEIADKTPLVEKKGSGGGTGAPPPPPKIGGSTTAPVTIKDKEADGTYERLADFSKTGEEAVKSNEGYRDKYDLMAKPVDASKAVKAAIPGTKNSRGSFGGFGDDMDKHIREASQTYGMDEKVLRGFIKMEGGYTGKMSPTGALGPGQFIQSTWDSLAATEEGKKIGMTKIGKRFRTADDPRHDKRINTLATALLAKQNKDMLIKAGLEPNGEMLYMMHNIGPGVINAVKTGEASPATLKAMQQNGMKPGMTPAGFVEYQKGRFNNHYAISNGVSPSESKPASSEPETAVDRSFGQERTVIKPTPTIASTSSQSSNSGSYMGSVENTKKNPGQVTPPTFTKDQLPKTESPFGVQQRADTSMGGFNMNKRPVPMPNDNSALNGLNITATESLNVQRQMLEKLEEISGKINFDSVIKSLNSKAAPAPAQTAPNTSTPPTYQSTVVKPPPQTKQIPKGVVSMSRV